MLNYLEKFCRKNRICADELVKFFTEWKTDEIYLGAFRQN